MAPARLLVCLILCAPLFAQSALPPYSDPSAVPFLVRLQRDRSGKKVCAIVRGDGLFHREAESGSHLEVSEGTLDAGELDELKTELANKDLVSLEQRIIPLPLALTERDEFLISILRSPLTQNLTFLDRESRRRFDAFIDPLLHWLEALRQHPHTLLGELAGNNCMPPRKIEFSARKATPTVTESSAIPPQGPTKESGGGSTPAPPARENPFLMRWELNHIANGVVEDTCIITYPSGFYRMERSKQEFQGKVKIHAFEGTLEESARNELVSLLDEPSLKSSTHLNLPKGQLFREGELTTLAISRDGQVQHLAFANYFAVPGFVSNISSSTDPEERIVKPLHKWLKSHIENTKTKPLDDATSTRCAAQPFSGNSEKH